MADLLSTILHDTFATLGLAVILLAMLALVNIAIWLPWRLDRRDEQTATLVDPPSDAAEPAPRLRTASSSGWQSTLPLR